jgi:hypothetical protein
LSQWLGWFWVEPRADIFHQKRKGVPLPLPINRFDLHAPGVEKFGSKDSQKTSHPNRFLLPAEPFSLSLSPPRRSATNIITTGLNTSIYITSNRPNTSYSERAAEPLSSATFLLPSPATDTGHHSLHRSLLSHQPNLLVATKLPSQVSLLPLPFLLLFLLLRRVLHCSRCMFLFFQKYPKNILFLFF